MKRKRVISVGAHSLDAELMGGLELISQAQKGAHCTFLHITRGERGHKTLSEEAYGEILLEENVRVAEKMGCDSHWIGYLAGKLPTHEVFVNDLIAYFTKENVELVISHWIGTMHTRHRDTHLAVKDAVFKMQAQGIDITLYYGENCEDLVGFIPQIYVAYPQEIVDQWHIGLQEYQIFRGVVNSVPYWDYYRTSLKVRQIEGFTGGPTRVYMVANRIVDSL